MAVERRTPDAKGWTPLVPVRESGDAKPFFCVHGAGGNVLNFRDLATRLPDSRPFYGLQARGADGASAPQESVEEMAADYLKAIRTVQPSGPYLIGGYSGGGIVSLEIARLLEQQGQEAALVVLLDTFHPQQPRRPGQSVTERVRKHLQLARSHGLTHVASVANNRLKHISFRFRAARLRLRTRLGLRLPLPLREIVMVEAFHKAAADYKTQRYDKPVVLFAAEDRSHIFEHLSPALGWEPYLEELSIQRIPGNHDSLVRKPNVDVLAKKLESALQQADNEPPTEQSRKTRATIGR